MIVGIVKRCYGFSDSENIVYKVVFCVLLFLVLCMYGRLNLML